MINLFICLIFLARTLTTREQLVCCLLFFRMYVLRIFRINVEIYFLELREIFFVCILLTMILIELKKKETIVFNIEKGLLVDY